MSKSGEGPPRPSEIPRKVLGVDIQSIDDARERLLYAGLFVIVTSKSDLLSGGLQPDAVVEAAGRSRRNFYDHFDSKEAFVLALFERFLLDVEVIEGVATDDYEDLPTTDLRSSVRSWFPQSVLDSIEVIGTLTSIVSGNRNFDDPLSETLREHNRLFDEFFGPRYEEFLQTWNIALTPSWTPIQVATVVRGAADGFVMRFRPSRDEFSEYHRDLLVSTVIGVLATAALDTSSGPGAQRAGTMSSLVDEMGNRVRGALPTSENIDARRSLRRAFLAELPVVSTEEITIPYLAERAGIATSTALRVSGTVKQLAGEVFDDFVTTFESSLVESADQPVPVRVIAHLRRLSHFSFEYAPLIRCWLGFLPAASTGEVDPLDRLVNLFGELLAEAPGPLLSGALLVRGIDVFELARTVTLTFLLPENQARSPVRSDYAERLRDSDMKILLVLKVCFVEPEGGWDPLM